jgi:hypothetical protein
LQTAERPSNASTSQLAAIVSTIRSEAEHKAASAVAAEIISSIFKRKPTDDPLPEPADEPALLKTEEERIVEAALQQDR